VGKKSNEASPKVVNDGETIHPQTQCSYISWCVS
jgi:hypothetical protein